MKNRILIAEDNEHYGTALALVLEAANMEVIGVVSTGRQAIEASVLHNPDVLLLDIAMPDIDGLAALSMIKYLCPSTKIIMITTLTDPSVRSCADNLGADLFLNKATNKEILINAIRAMDSDGVQVEGQTGTMKLNGTRQLMDHPSRPNFTPQEIRILYYLAQGQTSSTILDRLSISAHTLKTHMGNIFRKLGCKNRTQAAIWAIRKGFDVFEGSQVA